MQRKTLRSCDNLVGSQLLMTHPAVLEQPYYSCGVLFLLANPLAVFGLCQILTEISYSLNGPLCSVAIQ